MALQPAVTDALGATATKLAALRLTAVFDDASSVMTVISFATFLGIVGWTYLLRRNSDFDQAAQLPFADDDQGAGENDRG